MGHEEKIERISWLYRTRRTLWPEKLNSSKAKSIVDSDLYASLSTS